jgi:SulP family sulfate permease
MIGDIRAEETALGLLSFGLLILFPKRLSRLVPPQLLALVLGTLVSVILLSEAEVRRIGEIPTGLPELQLPVFTAAQWQLMIVEAAVLAVLGSIDALLTSVIAENLTRKESDSNKELFGQGMGNLASGLFGGIPGAGATMGTVVNIQTGGRSALSGLTRAILLLIVVLWAAGLTEQIPLAVLAGIALKVGIDIIDWSFLKRAHRVSFKAALIMYGVIALTVFVDLITAVAIGVFIANVLTIARMEKLQSNAVKAIRDANPEHDLTRDEQTLLEQANGKILIFALGGPLLFGVAKAISRKYAVLSSHEILIVDFTDVPILGVSSSLAVENIILEDLQQQRPVFIVGAGGDVAERLAKLGLLQHLPAAHVCGTRQEALTQATALLAAKKPETGSDTRATAG